MKGILFKTWPAKLQALKEFGQAQTRRVDKLANEIAATYDRTWVHFNKHYNWWELKGRSEFSGLIEPFVIKPRYQVGEVVYVKEAHKLFKVECADGLWIKAIYRFPCNVDEGLKWTKDSDIPSGLGVRWFKWSNIPKAQRLRLFEIESWEKWRSPMFMYEFLARYFLKILDVKPQRVQEITEEEALLEGVGAGFQMNAGFPDYQHIKNGMCELTQDIAVMSYATLWNSINPKYPWEMNPWEFTYTFERKIIADIPGRMDK